MSDYPIGANFIHRSAGQKVAEFLTSQAWPKPYGIEVIEAIIIAPGASGAVGTYAAGGGGGGCIRHEKIIVAGLTSIPIVVGSPGAGLTADGDGNDGGDSYVLDERFKAPGGQGGKYNSVSTYTVGGNGGGFYIAGDDDAALVAKFSGNNGGTYTTAPCPGAIVNYGFGAIYSGAQGGHGHSNYPNGGEHVFAVGGVGTGRYGGGGSGFGPGGDYGDTEAPDGFGGGSAGSPTASAPGAPGKIIILY